VTPAATAAGPVRGRREQVKSANRAAILRAGRDVFSETGYGAATVRDVIRRTDLASGTFYNYFPDKESVLRALVEDIASDVRGRVRAARLDATTLEGFVAGGFRAWFAFLAGDPQTATLLRRNAGTIRALFDEPAPGAGLGDLRDDLDAGIAGGTLPPHDSTLMAAAMLGAAVEVGLATVARDPVDVEGSVRFLTSVFLRSFQNVG
jgi:AcrR family transcriptional regulator